MLKILLYFFIQIFLFQSLLWPLAPSPLTQLQKYLQEEEWHPMSFSMDVHILPQGTKGEKWKKLQQSLPQGLSQAEDLASGERLWIYKQDKQITIHYSLEKALKAMYLAQVPFLGKDHFWTLVDENLTVLYIHGYPKKELATERIVPQIDYSLKAPRLDDMYEDNIETVPSRWKALALLGMTLGAPVMDHLRRSETHGQQATSSQTAIRVSSSLLPRKSYAKPRDLSHMQDSTWNPSSWAPLLAKAGSFLLWMRAQAQKDPLGFKSWNIPSLVSATTSDEEEGESADVNNGAFNKQDNTQSTIERLRRRKYLGEETLNRYFSGERTQTGAQVMVQPDDSETVVVQPSNSEIVLAQPSNSETIHVQSSEAARKSRITSGEHKKSSPMTCLQGDCRSCLACLNPFQNSQRVKVAPTNPRRLTQTTLYDDSEDQTRDPEDLNNPSDPHSSWQNFKSKYPKIAFGLQYIVPPTGFASLIGSLSYHFTRPEPSATPSPTASPSSSPSASASPSVTASVSASGTSSLSASPSVSSSSSVSPSPSSTSSSSPSVTPSVTASVSSSGSPSSSSSSSQTPSPTPTVTASLSASPTGSVSLTASASASPTVSPTSSVSLSLSASSSATISVSPSVTASATASLSASPSPSPSPSIAFLEAFKRKKSAFLNQISDTNTGFPIERQAYDTQHQVAGQTEHSKLSSIALRLIDLTVREQEGEISLEDAVQQITKILNNLQPDPDLSIINFLNGRLLFNHAYSTEDGTVLDDAENGQGRTLFSYDNSLLYLALKILTHYDLPEAQFQPMDLALRLDLSRFFDLNTLQFSEFLNSDFTPSAAQHSQLFARGSLVTIAAVDQAFEQELAGQKSQIRNLQKSEQELDSLWHEHNEHLGQYSEQFDKAVEPGTLNEPLFYFLETERNGQSTHTVKIGPVDDPQTFATNFTVLTSPDGQATEVIRSDQGSPEEWSALSLVVDIFQDSPNFLGLNSKRLTELSEQIALSENRTVTTGTGSAVDVQAENVDSLLEDPFVQYSDRALAQDPFNPDFADGREVFTPHSAMYALLAQPNLVPILEALGQRLDAASNSHPQFSLYDSALIGSSPEQDLVPRVHSAEHDFVSLFLLKNLENGALWQAFSGTEELNRLQGMLKELLAFHIPFPLGFTNDDDRQEAFLSAISEINGRFSINRVSDFIRMEIFSRGGIVLPGQEDNLRELARTFTPEGDFNPNLDGQAGVHPGIPNIEDLLDAIGQDQGSIWDVQSEIEQRKLAEIEENLAILESLTGTEQDRLAAFVISINGTRLTQSKA